MVSLTLLGWTLGGGALRPAALARPHLLTAYSQRPFLKNIYAMFVKFMVGFLLKNEKFPKFCSKSFFPRSTMKDSFSQKYKGKENPLKDVVDLSI